MCSKRTTFKSQWMAKAVVSTMFVLRGFGVRSNEDIFLQQYASVSELYAGVTRYFHHYNTQRPHQALGYKTPESSYYAKNQLAKELIIR